MPRSYVRLAILQNIVAVCHYTEVKHVKFKDRFTFCYPITMTSDYGFIVGHWRVTVNIMDTQMLRDSSSFDS